MEIDRVNRDTNDYYSQLEESEAKQRSLMSDEEREQAEQERIDEITDRLMGGDDSDLLAEVLNETPWCVKLLSLLCECETDKTIADMTEREIITLALAAKRLVESIQHEVKKGVEANQWRFS